MASPYQALAPRSHSSTRPDFTPNLPSQRAEKSSLENKFFSDLEFVTPASSLGSPAVTSDTDEADIKPKVKIDDEGEFRKRIYETYSIQLSDMQVIVGRLKDNWRHAQIKGKLVVHLHVLELVKLKMHVN